MKVFLIKEFVNLCTEFVNLETGKSQLIGRNMSTQKQEKVRYYVATAQNYNNQLFNKKEAKLNLASLKITISNLYKTNITNDYLYFDYV